MQVRPYLMVGLLFASSSTHAADVLHDTLCIVDDGLYLGNDMPCFCGGRDIYGESYNFQVADAFNLEESYWITVIAVDFLTLNGSMPDQVCAALYLGAPMCNDSRSPYISDVLYDGQFSWTEFHDTVYETYLGRRLWADLELPYRLPTGRWYVSLQPSTDADVSRVPAARSPLGSCEIEGNAITRWVVDDPEPCCFADPLNEWDWWCDGSFEPPIISMRVEGLPAGDCVGGEIVTANCRPGDGERLGKIIVKVRSGQPNGAVTALLDPPDPRSMSIALDDRGRGKGKFRIVPLGEHRVFVCDSIVDVTCAP
ncbi:MAG: hypothetical protein IT449_10360 [Phycisphaerales bacterium]|nr:hypothetical protein [Phycisphaerales bacterium]